MDKLVIYALWARRGFARLVAGLVTLVIMLAIMSGIIYLCLRAGMSEHTAQLPAVAGLLVSLLIGRQLQWVAVRLTLYPIEKHVMELRADRPAFIGLAGIVRDVTSPLRAHRRR